MLNFLGKRILQLIPTLFFVSILIFSLQHLLPGDPALVMAGEERDPDVIAHIRAQYRLDQPIPVQYVYWIKGVLAGDLGESMRIKEKVLDLILTKLPVTIQLASMAIVIALVIGITAGIVSAVKKDTLWDYAANVFALWGISTPNFWLGIMLIFLFSIELGWLPASGYVPLSENWRARPFKVEAFSFDEATMIEVHAAAAAGRHGEADAAQGPGGQAVAVEASPGLAAVQRLEDAASRADLGLEIG